MDRIWSVEIEAKKHFIEVKYNRNTTRTGKLMVNGNEAQTWKEITLVAHPSLNSADPTTV